VYLLRSDLIAALGAAAELEGYLGRAFAAMRTQPGFVRALLGNAPGQPAVYLSLVIWQSREAARGWSRGEAGRPFRDELRQQTFLSRARPSEAFDLLFERVATPFAVGHIGLAERTVAEPATQAAAFEETARAVSELRCEHGAGFVANGLARYRGDGGRYMAVLLYTSKAAADAIDQAPAIAHYRQTHPFGAFTGPAILSDYEPVLVVRHDGD
jgi:heme-degrading monooxygenase HmoA